MAKEFYVSSDGNQQGPYTLEAIASKVKSHQLKLTDYLFDEGAQDWIMLMEHKELSLLMKDHKPGTPPKPMAPPKLGVAPAPVASSESKSSPSHVEWYVLKGENKFGPFTHFEIIKLLQQKVIFEFDFAWNSGLNTWKRIAELEEFGVEKMRELQKTMAKGLEEIFFRRRHRRVQYGGTILIHDNKTVWKGQGVEISSGGAGVIMDNAMVVPGQVLYLHFKPGDGVPPFNAVCEVVSKKFIEGVKEKNASIRYGLKFTNIPTNTQEFLTEFTRKPSAA